MKGLATSAMCLGSCLAVIGASGAVHGEDGQGIVGWHIQVIATQPAPERTPRPHRFLDGLDAPPSDGEWSVREHLERQASEAIRMPAGFSYGTSGQTQPMDSVQAAWVRTYASALAAAYDYAQKLTIDPLGNVYVTGFGTDPSTFLDFITIKYNDAGQEQWVARYNGPGDFEDQAGAICVDKLGNVYVTGKSYGLGTDLDYVTIKYNDAGQEQWVARYNGPGNGIDYAVAIAADGSGGVYVTGSSYSPETSYDWVTIRYGATGVEEWVARRDGPSHGWDWATSLGLDGSGKVYVTGNSDGGYVTVKYNSAGEELWVARYDGPDHQGGVPVALAVETSGDVYVTGASSQTTIATVKYDSGGVEQWAVSYVDASWNVPRALALDGQGGVYITGWSDNECLTIKYASDSGALQWARRYAEDGLARGFALGADASANVYVTGYCGSDLMTIKYSIYGSRQWVARYDGPAGSWDWANALAVDAAGEVYVAGVSWGTPGGTECATVKYSTEGEREWVARYQGGGSTADRAVDLAIDSSGNVYLTGSSNVAGSQAEHRDYTTVKYSPEGALEWAARYSGTGDSDDNAMALAVDGSGNVYVTGSSYVPSTGYNLVTVKYNDAGVEQWVARYAGGPDPYEEGPPAIAVDGWGNVYVTGACHLSDYWHEYVTVKYDSSGSEQWSTRFGGSYYGWPSAIAIDRSGKAYVTSCSDGADYITIKYSNKGTEEWSARYDGTMNIIDTPKAIALDETGNVYVTGWSNYGMHPSDYATVKYDSAGVQQWVKVYGGDSDDRATGIAIDQGGNVIVSGVSESTLVTIEYDRDGTEVWVTAEAGMEWSSGGEIALDGGGNVYVAGTVAEGGDVVRTDYATVKYSGDGVRQWSARYDGPGVDELLAGIGVDGEGGVYVGGTSSGWYWSRYATVKYASEGCVDLEDPRIGVSVDPETLWPPNHEMVRVCGTVDVADDCDSEPEVTLVSVTSDEEENGRGDGDTDGDIEVGEDGCFLLRAERQGGGDGRVYTIKYCATDEAGRRSCDSATVVVPREAPRTTLASYGREADPYLTPLPNPFRSSTAIRYAVGSDAGRADINVYDAAGRHIRTLVSGPLRAGSHWVLWNGRRDDGQQAAAGIYFLEAHIDGHRTTHRMILLR